MTTDLFFRNPKNYIKELVECGQYQIAWDRGTLVKSNIDPIKHAELYFGKAYPYRILLVGNQGTAEYRPGDTFETPSAVYPTWVYGEDAALLQEMIESPVGEDNEACSDQRVDSDERPVFGQEHRIVITEIPPVSMGPGRAFLRYLKELQEDNPKAIIHLHGLYGFRVAFGMGFASVDVEPRTSAAHGNVDLPNGKIVKFESAPNQWVSLMGFKPVDLKIPRNRCMYNIKSAVWAAENYGKEFNFRRNATSAVVDNESTDKDFKPNEVKSVYFSPTVKEQMNPKDKYVCNSCTLQDNCRYYREGAVCSVPGAEPTQLAKYFKTRDSSIIIDGLGTLLATSTHRLETGLREEQAFGDLNPEVTKIVSQVFEQGVKLAKLVDPSLRAGPSVQVNVAQNNLVAGSNPQQMVAAAFRALELQGFTRDQITPEMIQDLLSNMGNQKALPAAIQGVVIGEE